MCVGELLRQGHVFGSRWGVVNESMDGQSRWGRGGCWGEMPCSHCSLRPMAPPLPQGKGGKKRLYMGGRVTPKPIFLTSPLLTGCRDGTILPRYQ